MSQADQRSNRGRTEKRAHSTRTACTAGRECRAANNSRCCPACAPLRGARVECAPPFCLRFSVPPCESVGSVTSVTCRSHAAAKRKWHDDQRNTSVRTLRSHSALSATIGSTRAARRAGKKLASAATSIISATAAVIVHGSWRRDGRRGPSSRPARHSSRDPTERTPQASSSPTARRSDRRGPR